MAHTHTQHTQRTSFKARTFYLQTPIFQLGTDNFTKIQESSILVSLLFINEPILKENQVPHTETKNLS